MSPSFPREHVRCPVCNSFERHRLDWLVLAGRTDLFDGGAKRMLHVAPEDCLSLRFRRIVNLDYLSADYVERMKSAGFDARVLRATDLVTEADCERMGFQPGRLTFFCRKPSKEGIGQ